MLRIIHTGRAYEVLDLLPRTYCFPDNRGLHELRDKYATLQLRYWQRVANYYQQNGVLGRACRRVWQLKELLENTEQKLRATELELTRCQAEYNQLEEAFDAGWGPERLRAQRAEAETEQLRRSLHDERIRRDEWKKMYHQAVMPELELCQKSTL